MKGAVVLHRPDDHLPAARLFLSQAGSTVFGVRFFAVLASAGTGWGVFLLARRLFDDRAGLWAVVLAFVAPLFAVGATLSTVPGVTHREGVFFVG